MTFFLDLEKHERFEVKNFRRVDRDLRKLRSYGPRSFAILSDLDGGFVQVAGGRVTCVVERRIKSDSLLERAFLRKPKVPFSGDQTLSFGAGRLIVKPDEFLFIDDVVDVFEHFFSGKRWPDYIFWRTAFESE